MGTHTAKLTVSHNAVTRFVQRVLGVEVDVDERDFGAAFVMHLHLFAAGCSLDAVEQQILTPVVVAGHQMGLTEIRTRTHVALIRGNCVATVTPPVERAKRRQSRLHIPTKMESRQRARRDAKRRDWVSA